MTFLLLVWLSAQAPSPEETRLELPSGRSLTVELARTPEERARGLMFRDHLDPDAGMLFVFPAADFHSFWMKNCRFPIDIIWLSAERKVVHIEREVPPCEGDPCPSYGPLRRAQFVLEVVAGLAEKEGLRLGDALLFEIPAE